MCYFCNCERNKSSWVEEYEQYPNCCTVMCLSDFYGDNAKEIEESIVKHINSDRYKRGIVTACTIHTQKAANKALRKLGFKSTAWVSKGLHPENKVRLWWKIIGTTKHKGVK